LRQGEAVIPSPLTISVDLFPVSPVTVASRITKTRGGAGRDTQSAHSLCKESHALTGDGSFGWTAKAGIARERRHRERKTPDCPYLETRRLTRR
jgi:hypothetical protein